MDDTGDVRSEQSSSGREAADCEAIVEVTSGGVGDWEKAVTYDVEVVWDNEEVQQVVDKDEDGREPAIVEDGLEKEDSGV